MPSRYTASGRGLILKTLLPALFLLLIVARPVCGQTITAFVPSEVDSAQTYLFYLHGGVVQEQGANAISQYYGAYDYLGILDTLGSYGYQVISEVRPKDTGETAYAYKLVMQVDTLLRRGADPDRIVIVGASLGAYITLEAAYKIKNNRIRYAILGLCSDYALEYFSDYGKELYGNFLSIYESSDSKGSCYRIFNNIPPESGYREIKLDMGIDHAFLYKPYKEWIQPLVSWIEE